MNERDLVKRIAELFSKRIGDDAAVVDDSVFTTDMLIEDVDFTRDIPLPFIARKSLAVNLSDIAAMGARPQYALVALGVPEWVKTGLDDFLVALRDSAKQHGVEIIGGDLSRAEKFTIAITAIGNVTTRPLLRSSARSGDRIYVSRPIGGAAAGLFLLQNGWSIDGSPPPGIGFAQREFAASAIRRQVDPEPEVTLGVSLAAIPEITACIDISDGLSTDLHHLCEASNCGAEIERERIPIFADLLGSGTALGIDARSSVLHGGEEYALLFTSSLRESDLSAKLRRPVYAIGRVTAGRDVVLKDGDNVTPLEPHGWDHFSEAGPRAEGHGPREKPS